MPQEKAYSSFNISGDGSTLPKSTLKEYADSATRPLFRFLFIFKKKIYIKYWVVKKGSFVKTKITIKTKIIRNKKNGSYLLAEQYCLKLGKIWLRNLCK